MRQFWGSIFCACAHDYIAPPTSQKLTRSAQNTCIAKATYVHVMNVIGPRMYTVWRCIQVQLQHLYSYHLRLSQVTVPPLLWRDLERCSRQSSFHSSARATRSAGVYRLMRVSHDHTPTLQPVGHCRCGAVRSFSQFFSSSETVFALSSGHGKCGKIGSRDINRPWAFSITFNNHRSCCD